MSTTWPGDEGSLVAGTGATRTERRSPVLWVAGEPASDQRAPNRALLERLRVPDRLQTGLGALHPAIAVLASLLGCVVLFAAVLIGVGTLMVHVSAHGTLGHWDEHVNQWFAARRSPMWNRLSGDFTALADTMGILLVAVPITAALLLRRWGRLAWLLAAGLAVELSVFLATNYAVDRPRPHVAHLGSTPSTSSWPSGHVAATMVLYGGIAVLVMVATSRRLPRVAAWTVAVGLIVCVALSRIYRGEHHPTDTIAGFVLGAAALWAAVFVMAVWSTRAGQRARPGVFRGSTGSKPGVP